MNVGEKSIIHILDAEKFGYGVEGIPPILGSMEPLDIEMEVLGSEVQSQFGGGSSGIAGGDVSAVSGMTGSGELGALDPMKPVSFASYESRWKSLFLNTFYLLSFSSFSECIYTIIHSLSRLSLLLTH